MFPIIRAMKKNGSAPPIFDFDEDHSYIFILLPVHPKEKSATKQEDATTQVGVLLRVMDGEQSREEIQKGLNLTNREHLRKGCLVPALESGLIERTIPEIPNSRLQKTASPPSARLSSTIRDSR